MTTIIYDGVGHVLSIDGLTIERGVPTEVPDEIVDRLLARGRDDIEILESTEEPEGFLLEKEFDE